MYLLSFKATENIIEIIILQIVVLDDYYLYNPIFLLKSAKLKKRSKLSQIATTDTEFDIIPSFTMNSIILSITGVKASGMQGKIVTILLRD